MLRSILIMKCSSKWAFAIHLNLLQLACVKIHRTLFVDEAIPCSEILAFSCVYIE